MHFCIYLEDSFFANRQNTCFVSLTFRQTIWKYNRNQSNDKTNYCYQRNNTDQYQASFQRGASTPPIRIPR